LLPEHECGAILAGRGVSTLPSTQRSGAYAPSPRSDVLPMPYVLSHPDVLSVRSFTPQKSIKKAYEQHPEAVQHRLEEQYPAIAERARR